MASTPHFVVLVMAQLAHRRFLGGLQFAMVLSNALHFAVDAATRPKYQEIGSGCFWYATKKGGGDVSRCCEVPDDLLESSAQRLALATEAIQVAASQKMRSRPRPGKRRWRANRWPGRRAAAVRWIS